MSATLDSGLTTQQIADAIAGDARDAAADAAMGGRPLTARTPRLRPQTPQDLVSALQVQIRVRDYIERELRARLGVYEPIIGINTLSVPWGESSALIQYAYLAGDPGQLSGPPERCYPPEPEEITILKVLINGVWCDDISEMASAAWIDQWETLISEHEAVMKSAFEEPTE